MAVLDHEDVVLDPGPALARQVAECAHWRRQHDRPRYRNSLSHLANLVDVMLALDDLQLLPESDGERRLRVAADPPRTRVSGG